MRYVYQEDDNGCVPAVIATLTGETYHYCKKLFPGKRFWDKRGTTLKQLLLVLSRLNFIVKERRRVKKSNAIVIVKSVDLWGGSGLHTIIWDAKCQRYFDPYTGRSYQRQLPAAIYKRLTKMILEIL
jgi:hypothetical protein